ncbi:MAG: hypothetical protein AB1477_06375 [Acidobacteriota bacterium]|jgi:hypothetical protein
MENIRLYRRSDGDLYEAVEGSQTDRILAALADFSLIAGEGTPEADSRDAGTEGERPGKKPRRGSER